jgi:hypothetical protein
MLYVVYSRLLYVLFCILHVAVNGSEPHVYSALIFLTISLYALPVLVFAIYAKIPSGVQHSPQPFILSPKPYHNPLGDSGEQWLRPPVSL